MSAPDRDYCYPPDFAAQRNRFGIRNAERLEQAERTVVQARIEQGPPSGQFDLAHLQAIHEHLFQDVYDWAGALRTVEINKGGGQFLFRQYIETGMISRQAWPIFTVGLRPGIS